MDLGGGQPVNKGASRNNGKEQEREEKNTKKMLKK